MVDVGGNLGYYAILAAAHGCRVKTFEPVPSYYAYLRYNVEINGFQDLIEAYNMGVSDGDGEIEISYFKPDAVNPQGVPYNWGIASGFGIRDADASQVLKAKVKVK
jgi:FkbM family methyltransferase